MTEHEQEDVAQWAVEGATVAVRNTVTGKVTFLRVKRVTATQVRLDNGLRYRRDRPHRQMGGRTWDARLELLPREQATPRAKAVAAAKHANRAVAELANDTAASVPVDQLRERVAQAQKHLDEYHRLLDDLEES